MNRDESSTVKFVPEGVKFEILLRSQVRSVIRWTKTSKSCYSLLLSEIFKKAYLQYSRSRPLLMFKTGNALKTRQLGGDGDHHPVICPFLNENNTFRLIGSFNGLVCMVFQEKGSLLVCNPATRKMRWLPVDSASDFWSSYGFGHDVGNDDYKIVKFRDDDEKELKIFSLKSGYWRALNWPYGKVLDDPGIYVQGSLHWMVQSGDNSWDVIAQNLSSETCQSLVLPPCSKEMDAESVLLGQSGEKLCICYLRGHFMEVWVMAEYGSKDSWSFTSCVSSFFSMTDFHNNILGEGLLFVAEEGCSVAKGTLECADGQGIEFLRLDDIVHVEGTPYIESFISPEF